MDEEAQYIKNNYFLENARRYKQKEVDRRYFSPIQDSPKKIPGDNILINNYNNKELSKFSDRPIIVNKQKTQMQRVRYASEDKRDLYNENNSSLYSNNNNYNNKRNYESEKRKRKKNIVIFTERPKKISDYILKNNNKQKVYQLTYLTEDDLIYDNYTNQREYQDYNTNREYNPKLLKKKKKYFNLNTFDDHYLLNEDYYNDFNNNFYNDFNNNFNYNFNNKNFNSIKSKRNPKKPKFNFFMNNLNLYVNNQNNDLIKLKKIQSVWRGHQLRKSLLGSLHNFYNIMRLFNFINLIFYNHSKAFFKRFFDILKRKNNFKNRISNAKTNIKKNAKSNKFYNYNRIINDKSLKEKININKLTVIDKKNISVFIPGDKKLKKEAKKNFIYKRKKNTPKNSPKLTKKIININNNKENNLKIKEKAKNIDRFKNINSKNKEKTKINNIVNYIIKKNIFLHLPLLLYRMRILQKMKLIEYKYKCLFNILKIKENLKLFAYFHKYRDIIFSKTINYIISENQFGLIKNSPIINNNNNRSIIKNKDNIPSKNNILKNNNKNINLNKKKEMLTNLIKNKQTKNNKYLLNKAFYKWKDICSNIFVLPELKSNKKQNVKLVIYNNKATSNPKKTFIKVKKIKSDHSKNFSHAKSMGNGKVSLNSFDSDNINVKKMKVQKVNVLANSKIKYSLTKDITSNYKSNEIVDNSYFIQKIANISRKISNKNSIFKCFDFWKKKTKEMK